MSTILQRSSPSATATPGLTDHPRPVTERVLITLLAFQGLTGHHWSWIGSVALGLGLVAWILAELWLLPDQLWALQGLYLAVGAAIVGLACSPQVRARLRRDG